MMTRVAERDWDLGLRRISRDGEADGREVSERLRAQIKCSGWSGDNKKGKMGAPAPGSGMCNKYV